MRYVIGIDGGGTRTTLAIASEDGSEILRREGPPGIVDPRAPEESAAALVNLARAALADAGVQAPVAAICAGLAGVGDPAAREVVRLAMVRAGIADRVLVVTDGETALEGALGSGAGILLVAGTGSIAYGRGEDGRVLRCGGWGAVVGDEGSGYMIGRQAMRAALRAVDGRGPATRLLDAVVASTGVDGPAGIPSWAGRNGKAEIARLASLTFELAGSGDAVALRIVENAASDLAAHAVALRDSLAPWSAAPTVVLHGGVTRERLFVRLLEEKLAEQLGEVQLRPASADAVIGAIRMAIRQPATRATN
ncbi:MAG TPA: BadF/BadG/BcrA/BcrD ATPase family protein [Longimicrobiaceae bacterium]|nr:BadF/BadG/BcrA/BcrD ATPase family protein [Longimicrobiaceae bacterium]